MKVDDLLEEKGRAISTTSPETAVIRVVERMRLERIGALVVSRDEERLDGVITERDVISAIARAASRMRTSRSGCSGMRTWATAERR